MLNKHLLNLKSLILTDLFFKEHLVQNACFVFKIVSNMDLFALMVNKQCESYVSHGPDQEAVAINAFYIPLDD